MMSVDQIIGYWNSLPFWLQVLIGAYISVSAVVFNAKKIYLDSIEDKELKVRIIWAVATSVGVVVAISGFILTSELGGAYWSFIACTGGTASMMIHKIMFKKAIPWAIGLAKKKEVRVVTRADIMEMPKKKGHKKGETKFVIGINDE